MESIRQNLDTYYDQFDNDLKEVIAANGRMQRFKAGDTIMQQGEFLKYTMLITKGRVKLLSEGDDGEEFFMYYLEPGQACALSFVCAQKNKRSDLDATVVEDTEAILIPIELMDELMIKNKSWYYFVLETYRSRFRELLDVIKSVAFHGMDDRLSYYLIKQKNAFNSKMISLTHEQIANDLNSSRVVISRLLKQMELQGKVKLHRNAVEWLQ
ncbi:MAG: Crp/Fnr family transcriptional regulator [Bacteroidota bacterium]|nr:Crp/Fnr family transcriptional regulator [Bacteroidota bacterium]